MHLLLWATDPRRQLKPLGQVTGNVLVSTWSSKVGKSREAFQAEVAAAGRHMAALDASPGGVSDDTEATAAAVACALMFEVLGSLCGVLPAHGWLRAKQLFCDIMVRCREHCCTLQSQPQHGQVPTTNCAQ